MAEHEERGLSSSALPARLDRDKLWPVLLFLLCDKLFLHLSAHCNLVAGHTMSAAHSLLQLAQLGQRIGVVSSGMQQQRYQRCLAAHHPLGRAGSLRVAASKGFGKAAQQPKKREEVRKQCSHELAEGETGAAARGHRQLCAADADATLWSAADKVLGCMWAIARCSTN